MCLRLLRLVVHSPILRSVYDFFEYYFRDQADKKLAPSCEPQLKPSVNVLNKIVLQIGHVLIQSFYSVFWGVWVMFTKQYVFRILLHSTPYKKMSSDLNCYLPVTFWLSYCPRAGNGRWTKRISIREVTRKSASGSVRRSTSKLPGGRRYGDFHKLDFISMLMVCVILLWNKYR